MVFRVYIIYLAVIDGLSWPPVVKTALAVSVGAQPSQCHIHRNNSSNNILLSDQPRFFYDSEKIILKVKAIVCEASVSLPAGTWYEAGQRHRIDKSRLAYILSVSNIGSHLFFQVLAMCDPERRQHHHPRVLGIYIWHPVKTEQAH